MALVLDALLEILRRPTVGAVFMELLLFLGPLWIAVLVGLVVGWAWKPKWANLGREKADATSKSWSSSWSSLLAPADGYGLSSLRLGSISTLNSLKVQLPSCITGITEERETCSAVATADSQAPSRSLSKLAETERKAVTIEDLDYLCKLVEVKDGGPAWIPMMDKSVGKMSYKAWRRDQPTGPPQYRSSTIFEDATPELVRDFFWDDEFRSKWDDMLIYSSTLEECPTTGTMVVQWIRKFPFFCSDREYIIGRRIWEAGRTYYCITKGVPCTSVPRHNKPRRVDLYYSSWCIRAVESKRGDGQLTACEVLLFHYEDMGIPWEIAKLGVRQGMWGCVKKIEPGLRAYQMARQSGNQLSRSAFMAQINSKINPDFLRSLETATDDDNCEITETSKTPEKQQVGRNIPKFLVIGGAVALACTLDRGLLTKAVIFGVARRFGKLGRRL
ncbi:hypothetical protein H6P81_008138 [Aristolochia fimbriata]|uniref:START domain-containing protein n=1 Tax=Aristolochia fimbriata TaxID=158543 RepID=A0AAV7F2V4_ARIFI|nr:hypothetical protein H6P81_008138 [Aristolochia fimbriata]